MREIKFRAWLKKEKKMVDLEMISFNNNGVIIVGEGTIKSRVFLFNQIELMQYIGLKDKNGVEIYEGDIAKLPAYLTGNTEYAICKWLDNRFSVEDVIGFGFIDLKEKRVISDEWEDFEVIGNIYKNPELLEKQ